MKIINCLKLLVRKIAFPHTYSSEAYVAFMRSKGAQIGDHCIIYSPNSVMIDMQRPHMLHIGDFCKITDGVKILTHDYSRSVLLQMPEYGNVGEAASTWIGDNVFIGMNAILLMGTHIGKNTIVGAGAVVSGHFEDNVVIAGNPAKVVCSIDEFYQRRKAKELRAAKEYVLNFRAAFMRNPSIQEMSNSFAWLYLGGEEDYKEYHTLLRSSGVDESVVRESFVKHMPIYDTFEEFLEDCSK